MATNPSTAISLPFSFNEFGQLNTTSDPRKIWQDRVMLVLMTKFGERVMRGNFGSRIGEAAFENEGIAIEVIQKTIGDAFNVWLKQLTLTGIKPVFDISSSTLSIDVSYRLPSGDETTTRVKTAILSRSGDILKEISNG
jgi:phage baseplate assembly protein W